MTGPGKIVRRSIAAFLFSAAAVASSVSQADWLDASEDSAPWVRCAECHGLFGDGNRIKFPRLAGQDASYITKQLRDFRQARRDNDGGQMQQTATEITEDEIPIVAQYFSEQSPPWPKRTIDADVDVERARTLAIKGAGGLKACLSCHSHAQLGMLDKPYIAPRIAGQRDFYIAKQLREYRDGLRSKNDPEQMMTKTARRLSDADIASLAVFLSQNAKLHEEPNP